MLNRFTVAGFVVALVFSTVVESRFPVQRRGNRWPDYAKSWLRRIVVDAGILVALFGSLSLLRSEKTYDVIFGAMAEMAVVWALSFLAIAFLAIHWLFTEKAVVPPLPPIHWQLDDEDVERSARFDTMRLRTEILRSPFDSDGEFLLHMGQKGANTWDESLKEAGWTEYEWKNFRVHEFEIRRLGPDRWEGRPTEKYWNRDDRQHREWAKYRETQPIQDPPAPRQWVAIDESWVPSIETAYQKYLLHPPAQLREEGRVAPGT
jgi:hypothetical protein